MTAILEQALQTNVADRIDPGIVSNIISQPPWIRVDGVPNCRDLGGNEFSSGVVRKGYMFRSGMLEHITEDGEQDIKTMGIRKILDLGRPRKRQSIQIHTLMAWMS